MKPFQKLLKLSPNQYFLLLSSMILLPVIRLSLYLSGFKKTYNRIIGQNIINQTQAQLNNQQFKEAWVVAHMINVASDHGLYRANCLTRSLLLMWMLKKNNIPCQLMIGADESDNINEFGAHAWVEYEGNVLNDQNNVSTHFRAFPIPNGYLK